MHALDSEEPFSRSGIDDEQGFGCGRGCDGDDIGAARLNECALGIVDLSFEDAVLPSEVGDECGLSGWYLIGAGDVVFILFDDACDGEGVGG